MSIKERITNRITKYYVVLHSRLYNTVVMNDIVSKFSMSLCPENMDKNKNVKQVKNKRRKRKRRQKKYQNCFINDWTSTQDLSA